MKNTWLPRIFFAATLLLLPNLQANPDLAEHYLSKGQQFLGKTVQVKVAYVSSYAVGPSIPGIVCYNAFTASGTKLGGSIAVCVKQEDSANFAKKYGSNFQYDKNGNFIVQPLDGVFSKAKLYGYYLDRTDGAAAAADPSKQ